MAQQGSELSIKYNYNNYAIKEFDKGAVVQLGTSSKLLVGGPLQMKIRFGVISCDSHAQLVRDVHCRGESWDKARS